MYFLRQRQQNWVMCLCNALIMFNEKVIPSSQVFCDIILITLAELTAALLATIPECDYLVELVMHQESASPFQNTLCWYIVPYKCTLVFLTLTLVLLNAYSSKEPCQMTQHCFLLRIGLPSIFIVWNLNRNGFVFSSWSMIDFLKTW